MRNRWQAQVVVVVVVLALLSGSVIAAGLFHDPVRDGSALVVRPTSTPVPTPTDTLTLDVTLGAKTPSTMGLGTNIQGWSDLAPTNGPRAAVAQRLLAGWKPQMVRVHVGFRGETPISAPEETRDVWDFTSLDNIITSLRALNLTYFLDIRTAPPWMYDNTGHLPVANFPLFARYMAQIVGWYNKGGFTDSAGVAHPSSHHDWVKTWEIWNEPKSGWDIPTKAPGYNPAAAPWMQPEVYAALYDTTVTAMREVDPSILTGGPALNSYPDDSYFAIFLQNVTAPLDFFSFHFYAEYDPKNPDQHLLDAVTGDRFLTRLMNVQAYEKQYRPGKPPIPIWITELGINESSLAARDPRGTAPIAYAFLADTLTTAFTHGVQQIDQFCLASDLQLGLMDNKSNAIYRPYGFYQTFTQQFPSGSTLITTPKAVDAASGLTLLAMVAPDGKSLRVLVGNIKVAHPTDVNGAGVAKNIRLLLKGTVAGHAIDTAHPAQVWRFDATTPATLTPAPTSFTPLTDGSLPAVQGTLTGYGALIFSVPLV